MNNRNASIFSFLFTAYLVFIAIPLQMFSNNLKDFASEGLLLLYGSVLAIVVAVSLFVVSKLSARIVADRLEKFIFGLGVFVVSSHILNPLPSFVLDGNESEHALESATFVGLDIIVLLFGFLIVLLLHIQVIRKLATGVLIVFFLNDMWLISKIGSFLVQESLLVESRNDSPKTIERPNVYHFVLDTFASDQFLPIVNELKAKEQFEGFIFFKETLANYLRTQESVPSFMTGTLADTQNMKEWSNSYRRSGLLRRLYDAGYQLHAYTIWEGLGPQGFGTITEYYDIEEVKGHIRRKLWFLDLWLLRLVPSFLRQEVFNDGSGLIGRLYVGESAPSGEQITAFNSYSLLERVVAEERLRASSGTYVYSHVLFPHSPYVFDRNCNFVKDETSFRAQSACAIRVVIKLLEELRRLNRFNDSVIIIQSDHAEYFLRDEIEFSMPPDFARQLEEAEPYGFSASNLEARAKALFLLKPPSSPQIEKESQLLVSKVPTQLLDVYSTVLDAVGLSSDSVVSQSALSLSPYKQRTIPLFTGFVRVENSGAERKRIARFGEEFLQGEVVAFERDTKSGWKMRDPVEVNW